MKVQSVKRASLVLTYLLAVIITLAASSLVLLNAHCRMETLAILIESIEVGIGLAMLKWFVRLQKPVMLDQPVSEWIALLRLFTATETKYALAGGYLLALVKGCCHLAGW